MVQGRFVAVPLLLQFLLVGAVATAQTQSNTPRKPLPDAPVVFDGFARSSSGTHIPGPNYRVVPILGLNRLYGMAFLPDGRMLITERAGRIRIVKDSVLDPQQLDARRQEKGLPSIVKRIMDRKQYEIDQYRQKKIIILNKIRETDPGAAKALEWMYYDIQNFDKKETVK